VVKSELVKSEATARYVAMQNKPAYYCVRSNTAVNKWGMNKAYRIMPMGNAITLLGDNDAYKFASYAKYNVAFTKYHDEVSPKCIMRM
jgi:hypothetical protein